MRRGLLLSSLLFPALLACGDKSEGNGSADTATTGDDGGGGDEGGGEGGGEEGGGEEGGGEEGGGTGGPDDTGVPEDQGGCAPGDITVVESVDVAADGMDFTIRGALDPIDGTWDGTTTWEDGTTAAAQFRFTGEVWNLQLREFEWNGPDDVEPQECPPAYEVETRVRLSMGDGGEVDEDLRGRLMLSRIGEAELFGVAGVNQMNGTLRPSTVGESEWGEFDLVVRGSYGTTDGWTGEAVFEERPDPGGGPGGGGEDGGEDGGGEDGGGTDTAEPPEPTVERIGTFAAGTAAE